MTKLDELRDAVARHPDSASAQLKLGTYLLLKKQDAGAAEQAFRRALELNPSYAKAWVNLGGLLLSRWDFQGCVEANQRALACQPDLLEAHYNLGLGYLYLGEAEAMLGCFRRVVELAPDHAGGHYHLAVGLLHLDRLDEARAEAGLADELGYALPPEFLRELEKKIDSADAGIRDTNR